MFTDFPHSFYYCCLFLSAWFGIMYFRIVSRPFLFLILLVWLVLISELFAKYVSYVWHQSNNFVYHIFTPFEFFIYGFIYSQLLGDKKLKIVISILVLFIFVFEVINTFFLQSIHQSNTNTIIVENIFLVTLSLMLFIRIKEVPTYQNLLTEPVFWFNSIILIYYAFNIMIWGFHNLKVYNLANPPNLMYDINLVFSGMLYLIFSIVLYLEKIKPQSNLIHHG